MPDRATLRAELERSAAFGAPSERFRYSNLGYALLGEVLETATATSFAALLRREIARPLGLAATDADLTAAARRALATGYYAAWPGEPHRAAAHVEARAIAPGRRASSPPSATCSSTRTPSCPATDACSPRCRSARCSARSGSGRPSRTTASAGCAGTPGRSGSSATPAAIPGFTTKIAFAPERAARAPRCSRTGSRRSPPSGSRRSTRPSARWPRGGTAPPRRRGGTPARLARRGSAASTADNFGTLDRRAASTRGSSWWAPRTRRRSPRHRCSSPTGPLRFNVADGRRLRLPRRGRPVPRRPPRPR